MTVLIMAGANLRKDFWIGWRIGDRKLGDPDRTLDLLYFGTAAPLDNSCLANRQSVHRPLGPNLRPVSFDPERSQGDRHRILADFHFLHGADALFRMANSG